MTLPPVSSLTDSHLSAPLLPEFSQGSLSPAVFLATPMSLRCSLLGIHVLFLPLQPSLWLSKLPCVGQRLLHPHLRETSPPAAAPAGALAHSCQD